MTTQQTPSITERVSRLEGSYERIGDVVRSLEGHRAETRAGFDASRSETNVRFESVLGEIRAARADSDAKFDVMRQEMNERFRSLTTVLTTGVAVLATILVGIVGAIIGLYARTG